MLAVVRLNRRPEPWRLGPVWCEYAHRNGIRDVEALVLHDDDWACIARVILAARYGPDVTAPCSSPASDTVSVDAPILAGMRARCHGERMAMHSQPEEDARASAIQICIRRRSCDRTRLRQSRTFDRESWASLSWPRPCLMHVMYH